ncbi:diguanylate cyclase, partial [Desulfosarcina sp. OttesenSCG-928-G17]|nr:diguanylate cyclase [Desulfosarcina sp. OttesenSCG-928-G17]
MASHILIVDHEPSTLKTMEAFLGRFGYRVSSVSSAEEAIRLLEHLEGNGPVNVDVVITDILLPGMNGLDMTDRIKSRWNVDVMVMTGYTPDYSYEAAVSKGASDFVFKPIQLEELNLRLKRVLRERKLNRERLEMMDELKALSITDDLTQLYNSRYFYIHIKMEIDRFNRYGHDLSLLFLDIDLFKIHNDTYGHVEGDKVLVRIAQLIRSCLRKMDTAYRYGGEEFTVILPETPAEEALTVAERLRAVVAAESFPVPGALAHLTISVGVTQYIREESVTDFVKRADAAMYRAKQAGRNKVTCVWGALNSDLSHIRQVNTEKPRAALPMAEKASDPEKS